ncbi:MAG: hypothetical protein EXR75_01335 [Myxococcales bacterium]|nr:hypothetical protein [Myxococcales bacterium]
MDAYAPVCGTLLEHLAEPRALVSYEDFVHMSALVRTLGCEMALGQAGLSMAEYTRAFALWQARLLTEPERSFASHFQLVEAEAARLQAGAPARTLEASGERARAVVLPLPSVGAPSGASIEAPETCADAEFLVAEESSAWAPGAALFVLWPDGNRYPGVAVQEHEGHVLVSFEGGAQQWVPFHALVRGT